METFDLENTPLTSAEQRILDSALSENAIFQHVFSQAKCLQALLRACPPINREIRLSAVHYDKKLTPAVGKHEYILDVLGEGEYVDTGTKVIIDLEMQNTKSGAEQVRGETYAAAVRCTVTARGEGWKDMPEVISIFFVNEIPEHKDLYYRVTSFHSYGYSGAGNEFEDDEGNTLLIYVRLGLDKQTELLKRHPELQALANIVHDLSEKRGSDMIVGVLAEAMSVLKEDRLMLFKCSQETLDWGERLKEEARAEAMAEARAQARAEAKEEKERTVVALCNMGMPLESVAKACFISVSEVEAIRYREGL